MVGLMEDFGMTGFWWFIFFPIGVILIVIVLLLLLLGVLKLERIGYQEFRLRVSGNPMDFLLDGLRRRGFSAYREGEDVVVQSTLINMRIRLVGGSMPVVAWWAEIPALTVVLLLIGLLFGIVIALLIGLLVYLKYNELNNAIRTILVSFEETSSG